MRGKRRSRAKPSSESGLIPAHAGKTCWLAASTPVSTAHPRACGENFKRDDSLKSPAGSSPRMRGKPAIVTVQSTRGRLIPAHAGKTLHACQCMQGRRAHPRACGENIGEPTGNHTIAGSSPRMRGKLPGWATSGGRGGLIPAHAGKTAQVIAFPRENCGSSPRMRGKHEKGKRCGNFKGLIPAHAGKTQTLHAPIWHARAHPRACGENVSCRRSQVNNRGSSPRMRGKLTASLVAPATGGLIPAHAGKTHRDNERR